MQFDTSQGFGSEIGQHLLWSVAADGSNLHRLLAGWHTPPDECCGTWSRDGRWFLFQSQGQIWALPRSRLAAREAKPIPVTSSPMSLSSPLVSADGRKLFLVGATYRGELTRYDVRSRSVPAVSRVAFRPSMFRSQETGSGSLTSHIRRQRSGAAGSIGATGCSSPTLHCVRSCRDGRRTGVRWCFSNSRSVRVSLLACIGFPLREDRRCPWRRTIPAISRIRSGRLTEPGLSLPALLAMQRRTPLNLRFASGPPQRGELLRSQVHKGSFLRDGHPTGACWRRSATTHER